MKISNTLTEITKDLIGIKFPINSPSIAKPYAVNEINQRLDNIFSKKREIIVLPQNSFTNQEIENLQNNKDYEIGYFFKGKYNEFTENSICIVANGSSKDNMIETIKNTHQKKALIRGGYNVYLFQIDR